MIYPRVYTGTPPLYAVDDYVRGIQPESYPDSGSWYGDARPASWSVEPGVLCCPLCDTAPVRDVPVLGSWGRYECRCGRTALLCDGKMILHLDSVTAWVDTSGQLWLDTKTWPFSLVPESEREAEVARIFGIAAVEGVMRL